MNTRRSTSSIFRSRLGGFASMLLVLLILTAFQGVSLAQAYISVSSTSSVCPNNGSITITIFNGTGPFIYELISGPGTPFLQNSTDSTHTFASLAAGTYIVKVTDQVPTVLTDTIVVTGNYTTPSLSFSKTETTCPNDSTGSFTVHVTGGLPPMSYQISAPSAFATGWLNDSVFTGLPANTYTVGILDSCGTIQTANVTITSTYNNFEPEADFTLISCDSIQWSVTVPEHGEPPFSFQMTAPFSMGPQSTGSFTVPDSITSYSFQVTDACGINETVTRNINQALNVTSVRFSCDSANLTASTTNFYGNSIVYMVLSGSDTLLTSPVVNLNIGAGTYVVYAFNECGDTLSQVHVFTPGSIAIVDVDVDISKCNLGMAEVTVTINGSGGLVTFAFISGPPGFPLPDPIVTTNTSVTYDSLIQGTYVYSVTDTCGLSDTLSFNINESLTVSLSTTHIPGCAPSSETIEAEVTSNVDPDWFFYIVELDSNGMAMDTFSGPNTSGGFNNLAGGTYVIRVRSEDCPGIYYYDTISFNSYTALSILALEGLVCDDSSLTIIASAGGGVPPYSYEIIQGPVLVSPQSSPVFSNLPYGTNYRVRVADSCGNAIVQDISPSPLNVLAPGLQDTTVCVGGDYSVDVVLLGGVTYEWFDNTGSPMVNLDIQDASLADSGDYVLIISIPGCDTLTDTAHIAIILPPLADAGPDTTGMCFSLDSVCREMAASPLQPGETGYWSVIDQPLGHNLVIMDSTDPNTMVVGDEGVTYTLQWTVDNGFCESVDTVFLDFACTFFLGPDDIYLIATKDESPRLMVHLEHPEHYQRLDLQQRHSDEDNFELIAFCMPPFEADHLCEGVSTEGASYYRVRGMTYDGDFVYSNVIATAMYEENKGEAYPNPVNDLLSITMGEYHGSYPLSLTIFNAQGQHLHQQRFEANCVGLNMSSFPAGMYIVVVANSTGSIILREWVVVAHPN